MSKAILLFQHVIQRFQPSTRLRGFMSIWALAILIGCGIEFGNPSDDNDKDQASSVTGVVAEGAAVTSVTVQAWDSAGEQFDATTTEDDGSYTFRVPSGTEYPLLLCATSSSESTLCTVVEKSPGSGKRVTRHLNPITSQVVQEFLSLNVTEVSEFSAETIAGLLAAVETGSYDSVGQSVIDQIFGSGLSFDLYHNDDTFIALHDESTTPSIADFLLDNLGQFALREDQNIHNFLESSLDESSSASLLNRPRFQVELASRLVTHGLRSDQSTALVATGISDSSLQEQFDNFITQLQSVNNTASSQLTDTEREIAVYSMAEALVTVFEEEESVQSSLSIDQRQKIAKNVVNALESDLIESIREQRNSGAGDTFLEIALRNSGQHAGFLVAQLQTTEEFDDSTLEALREQAGLLLDETIDPVIEQSAGGTADAETVITTLKDTIEQLVTNRATTLQQKEALSSVLKASGVRPSQVPGLSSFVKSKAPIPQEPGNAVVLASESRVTELDLSRDGSSITIELHLPEGHSVEMIELAGTLSNQFARGEVFIDGEETPSTQRTDNSLNTLKWEARRVGRKLLDFRVFKASGRPFKQFSLKIQVPLQQNGRVTGRVVLFQ